MVYRIAPTGYTDYPFGTKVVLDDAAIRDLKSNDLCYRFYMDNGFIYFNRLGGADYPIVGTDAKRESNIRTSIYHGTVKPVVLKQVKVEVD